MFGVWAFPEVVWKAYGRSFLNLLKCTHAQPGIEGAGARRRACRPQAASAVCGSLFRVVLQVLKDTQLEVEARARAKPGASPGGWGQMVWGNGATAALHSTENGKGAAAAAMPEPIH